ncbi:MAG: MFS transporter [Planctomycetota bacterium]|jgi:predicted MFS family arabinose efflux permease
MDLRLLHKTGADSEQLNILLSSFAAVSGIGLLSYAALPFLIGASIESLELSEASVGFLYTLEFLAAAISSFIVAPRIGEIRRRNLAFVGASVVIAGNFASAWWCHYEALLVIRPFTGVGAGLALACGNATIANAKYPARIAGMMNVLFAGLVLLLMLILPMLSSPWGVQGVYFGLVAVTLVFLLLLRRMPQRAITADPSLSSGNAGNTRMFNAAGIAILGVFFMFTLRDSMAWGFVERIGVEVGYTTAEVGAFLSLQALIGLLGPMTAALIGFRFGVGPPLLFALAFAGLTTYALFLSVEAPYLFEIVILFFTAAYFLAISYLTAYAATLDAGGRIVAASGSAMVLGVAVGPAFSGHLITYGGYGMGATATLALVIAMISATVLSLKWAQKPGAEQVAPPYEQR